MAKTDYQAAAEMDAKIPHTHVAMTNLLTKMAKCDKYRNKKPFFGIDKKRKAQEAFEIGTKELVSAMRLDGIVKDNDNADTIRSFICELLAMCMDTYPNWPDAYRFATETFAQDHNAANAFIQRLCL